MIKGQWVLLAVVLGGAATPAAAMQNPTPEADGDYGIWFKVELAPAIVSDGPFRADSPTTDSTDISWLLNIVQPLGGALEFEAELGPTATVDSDNDSEAESAFVGSLEVRTQQGFAGFTPFIGYSIELSYADFFGTRSGTTHSFQLGVDLEGKRAGLDYELRLAPQLIESNEAFGDYFAVPLSAEFSIALIPNRMNLVVEGAVERRWYRDLDPNILAERRDWRVEAYAGIDFAGGVNELLATPDLFDNFAIGVRWLEVGSNVDDEDESDIAFAPSLTLKIPIPPRPARHR